MLTRLLILAFGSGVPVSARPADSGYTSCTRNMSTQLNHVLSVIIVLCETGNSNGAEEIDS
jgi:hypothetical protein